MTGDPQGRAFKYDGENKQYEVRNALNDMVGQYFFDGNGKRVKKIVPSTGEVTVSVYDASGRSVAEYSTVVAPAQDAKVAYLKNDHLGSPRIKTDRNGVVISRNDYLPFGEDLFTPQRTQTLGYTPDDIRQKFTGYERDDETDLDYAKARMFGSSQGRFTSPDDFLNDTHVSDPQSWNLYIYVRNNPLRLTDPEGKKGEITSRYDKKTGVTTITITASFALYSVAGQNISRKELESYKKNLIDGIKAAFDGTYKDAKTGRSFVIETNISAAVFDSKEAATNAGADNLVEFSNDELDGAWAAVSGDETGSDLVQVVAGREGSPFESKDNIYQKLFGHEFGHLLGLPDSKETGSLMNYKTFEPKLNSADFNNLFGGTPIYLSQGPPLRDGTQQTVLTTSLGSIASSTAPSFERRYAGIVPAMDWIKRVKK